MYCASELAGHPSGIPRVVWYSALTGIFRGLPESQPTLVCSALIALPLTLDVPPFPLGVVMSSLLSVVDILVLLSFILALRVIRGYQYRGGFPYPPGPRPLPIIGNLLHIPKEFSWLAYAHFAEKYGIKQPFVLTLLLTGYIGDIISFHVFGQVIVVLNSIQAAKDLLEKRGDVYSDRPMLPIIRM